MTVAVLPVAVTAVAALGVTVTGRGVPDLGLVTGLAAVTDVVVATVTDVVVAAITEGLTSVAVLGVGGRGRGNKKRCGLKSDVNIRCNFVLNYWSYKELHDSPENR